MRFDQLSSQSTRAATGCAIALGFSIPVSVALDNILLAAVLLLWLVGAGFREKLMWLREIRVTHAAIALFVLLAAGIAWSTQPGEGFHILGKYADLAFIPIFATLFRSQRNRRLAGLFFVTAIVVTLVLSYLIWMGLLSIAVPANEFDVIQPEVFKKYLTQSILMACSTYVFSLLSRDAILPRMKILWGLLAALCAVNVIVMLPGRSGQIVLAALALVFAISRRRSKGIWAVTAVLVLAASAILLGYAPENSRINTAIKDFKSWRLGQASNTSTGQRLDYATRSAAIVIAHPWIGVGTGGFAAAYAHQVEGTNLEATVNPHNEYLNLAVQLGIAGPLAACLLFFLVWRHARALPTALERDLARGLAVTFAVGCLFNSLLMDHVEGLFFAWSAGVLFGGYNPAQLQSAHIRS